MTSNARTSERFQFENADQVVFFLTDQTTQTTTSYCLCNDFSKAGALLIADMEFPVGKHLTLKAHLHGELLEEIPVKVARRIADLCDEERFCVAVEFLQPVKIYRRLQRRADSIAA